MCNRSKSIKDTQESQTWICRKCQELMIYIPLLSTSSNSAFTIASPELHGFYRQNWISYFVDNTYLKSWMISSSASYKLFQKALNIYENELQLWLKSTQYSWSQLGKFFFNSIKSSGRTGCHSPWMFLIHQILFLTMTKNISALEPILNWLKFIPNCLEASCHKGEDGWILI